VATASGLRNAATCEFLYDGDGHFWFLEVNTRLQVEHPVTELVAGVDIVQEQFWLAAGAPLSDRAIEAGQRAATPTSHAIELRLSAEDPGRGFAPTPGRVTRWIMPGGPGIRIDTATGQGTGCRPNTTTYRKLIVHAADRPTAIARLGRALDEIEVGGIQTTVPFDLFVIRHPTFREGDLSTSWVTDHWDAAVERARAVEIAQLAVGLAALQPSVAGDGPGEGAGPPMSGGSGGSGGSAGSVGPVGRSDGNGRERRPDASSGRRGELRVAPSSSIGSRHERAERAARRPRHRGADLADGR
jgi:acetyl/propionyl-CoA carboxylase alpha subunit